MNAHDEDDEDDEFDDAAGVLGGDSDDEDADAPVPTSRLGPAAAAASAAAAAVPAKLAAAQQSLVAAVGPAAERVVASFQHGVQQLRGHADPALAGLAGAAEGGGGGGSSGAGAGAGAGAAGARRVSGVRFAQRPQVLQAQQAAQPPPAPPHQQSAPAPAARLQTQRPQSQQLSPSRTEYKKLAPPRHSRTSKPRPAQAPPFSVAPRSGGAGAGGGGGHGNIIR